MTNEFMHALPDDLGSSYADVVLHRLGTNISGVKQYNILPILSTQKVIL